VTTISCITQYRVIHYVVNYDYRVSHHSVLHDHKVLRVVSKMHGRKMQFGGSCLIWNPIFGICLVYTIHIVSSSICMVYVWYIHGISLDIPCISSSISMVYPWIYMVYHWMYIHGIYVVHRGISMDIPRFLKPVLAAGQCWSHSMRTRVWVNQECLFHAPPWQLRQGTRRPTKGSTRLPPTFPACRWWRR
jgi:hypothetical protein